MRRPAQSSCGPVVRRRSPHGVEGRIRRAIGGQRKEEEACGHQQHHAGHFIQATVARRGQCQFEWLHRGYAVLAACAMPGAADSERQSGFIIPEIGSGKPKTAPAAERGTDSVTPETALQATEKVGFVSGHDFSRAVSA